MRIQHNIAALNSYRQLGGNNNAVGKNLEKLSSGYRINRAGDDAAGLAISEKMRAQIKGLETAQKNANDGISLVQTAEGALTEVHSMLNRMVELATQSSNGTYDNTTDRANLQKEVASLQDEIDRIAESTNFNGIKLLDGSMGTGTTGVEGTIAAVGNLVGGSKMTVSGAAGIEVALATRADISGIQASWVGSKLTISIGGDANQKFTQADLDKALAAASDAPDIAAGLKITIDKDIAVGGTATTGVTAGGFGATDSITTAAAVQASAKSDNGITVTANKAGARAAAATVDFNATGSVGVTKNAATGALTVNLEAGKSYSASDVNQMLSAAGVDISVSYDGTKLGSDFSTANFTPAGGAAAGADAAFALGGGAGLAEGGGLTLQVGDTNESFQKVSVKVGSMSATALGIGSIDVSTQEGAANAIKNIKDAINSVSSTRGDLGAIQNRLEHTINNLGVTTENMTAAESRIRDVDMAKEMMDFTKNNILTQAAQAMLAQANQIPQGVLQLLQ